MKKTKKENENNIPELKIDDPAIERLTSRSGGPGGQNVQKRETKVTLRFDIDVCMNLSKAQREILKQKISGAYLSQEHIIEVSSQKTRSQKNNEADALNKLNKLIEYALVPHKERETAVPKTAKQKRKRKSRQIKENRKLRIKWRGKPDY